MNYTEELKSLEKLYRFLKKYKSIKTKKIYYIYKRNS